MRKEVELPLKRSTTYYTRNGSEIKTFPFDVCTFDKLITGSVNRLYSSVWFTETGKHVVGPELDIIEEEVNDGCADEAKE